MEAHQKLLEKMKELPDESLEQLSNYIDFLYYKQERDAVNEGLEDIKNGRVHSNESVMDEIDKYINSKKKS